MGPSEAPGCSRIVMVVPGGPAGTENIQRQLLKLIYVQKVAHPHLALAQLCARPRSVMMQYTWHHWLL